jgi:hypothetical protein
MGTSSSAIGTTFIPRPLVGQLRPEGDNDPSLAAN